jgi:DNA-binding CsgD family transcriptional regulator
MVTPSASRVGDAEHVDENNYRQTYFGGSFADQLWYEPDAMSTLEAVPHTDHHASPASARVPSTNPRDLQIAAAYRSGKTMAATGAMFGITRERVRQILAKVSEPSRRTTRFPSAVGDKVARLYKRGETIDAAAKAVGVSAFTARNMLVERGIERLPGVSAAYRRASTRKRQESMVRLYRQGKTFKELAQTFGTSTTSVQRVLDRLGVERRRRRGRPRTISSNDDLSRVDQQITEGVPVQV